MDQRRSTNRPCTESIPDAPAVCICRRARGISDHRECRERRIKKQNASLRYIVNYHASVGKLAHTLNSAEHFRRFRGYRAELPDRRTLLRRCSRCGDGNQCDGCKTSSNSHGGMGCCLSTTV